ncbi:MAG TPA: glycerol-3-phosphate dehydrogenase [Devosiaceae bacterium]
MSGKTEYDLLVIGGGVNGCGIARDAAGRGYSVMLAEMDDLASGTSSAATKLIHGGLRYLEYYEFRLVREALTEREVLWAMAPHIIWPLRFVLPYQKGLRPPWMLRAGLFLYDYIGGRKRLPPTRTLNLKTDEAGKPLKPGFGLAFEYSDCWVDDARLVALNAMDAAARGATIRTRTKVTGATRQNGHWSVRVRDQQTGAEETVSARMLVNAAGPWVDQVLNTLEGRKETHNVRLVQGSHIVLRRLYGHDRCYFFQNRDGRIFFAIPYETDFTLIGTTDLDYKGDPHAVHISDGETDYLLAAAGEYFAQPLGRDDIVWTYSGVRPLFDDGASKAQEATRDYVIKLDHGGGSAPLVNVFGGKLTTYRRLSEEVLERIEGVLGKKGPQWTARSHLPGGDFAFDEFEVELERFANAYAFLDPRQARRLFRQYGSKAYELVGAARAEDDLGRAFGGGLTEAEVNYLRDHEWAKTADDILWRRTKLGLRLSSGEKAALADYLGG